MKQSQLFIKTSKDTPRDEPSINAQLLYRAGYIDKLMAGVFTILPLGLRVMKKIENIIRQEINAIDGQEIVMPALQPKDIWETTGRWEAMTDLYKLQDASGREFALGPTHEEVVVPLLKKFITSYKDLPVAVYQFQDKFRMELRAKSGILRGREFVMKDLYSFHLTVEDLDAYYERAKSAYFNIFKQVGLGEVTHLTYASGGTFSKYSHEFQAVTEAGEDTIYLCQKCQQAVNKEVKDDLPQCPNCQNTDFRETKAIEVGNIFKLMTKYSQPFDLSVTDSSGTKQEVVMGCYGIGLGRLMGTVVEVHHDDRGIIWPKSITPFQVHLLLLSNDEKKKSQAIDLVEQFTKFGLEVLFDDREVSAGTKFADSDLLGISFRVVVGDKTESDIEYQTRDGSLSGQAKAEDLINLAKQYYAE